MCEKPPSSSSSSLFALSIYLTHKMKMEKPVDHTTTNNSACLSVSVPYQSLAKIGEAQFSFSGPVDSL